jgi:hypothetical protein
MLSESYAIALKLGLTNGIAVVGVQLAQILAVGGLQEEAISVLDVAEVAFQKLRSFEDLTDVRRLRDHIRKRTDSVGIKLKTVSFQ